MITLQAYPDEDHDIGFSSKNTADLLLRARKGDPSAWEEIVRRYNSVVFTTARSFRLQDADVLDAVQMTWLRLAEYAHRVQDPERLAGWLAATARRECLHILRQQAKRAATLADSVVENVVDPDVGPEQRVIVDETTRTLWNLVDKLPPRQRVLLRMLFTDNPLPFAEAARVAGIPIGGIGPTRARALRQLRHQLDEYGLASESNIASGVEEKPPEGERTGSYRLDSLLDKTEDRLRDELESRVTGIAILAFDAERQEKIARSGIGTYGPASMIATSDSGTGDAHIDGLLNKADSALRERTLLRVALTLVQPDRNSSFQDHPTHASAGSAPQIRIGLGAQLRQLREAKGITHQTAGHAIRASVSKIIRMEQGRIVLKQRDVADLLTLYGIYDEQEREIFLALAQQANLPGWVDIQVAG